MQTIIKRGLFVLFMGMLVASGALFSRFALPASRPQEAPLVIYIQDMPTETIPPNTPLASVTPLASATPERTLKPPPTFEPPTPTPLPTSTPSVTPTQVVDQNITVPGLNGAESPTPSSTPGCELRDDWKLTYEVKFDDALSTIAAKYGTYADDLAEGNCLADKNLIRVGQVLRVPGDAHPVEPEVACVPFELFTPINGAVTVPADGMLTFNWRGPLSPKSLIRVIRPDGSVFERLVELRQHDSVNMNAHLQQGGTYTWYVYPLGNDFQQIPCAEGGPRIFSKPQSTY